MKRLQGTLLVVTLLLVAAIATFGVLVWANVIEVRFPGGEQAKAGPAKENAKDAIPTGNDAEQILRQLEVKLKQARTFECAFEIKREGGPSSHGKCTLMEGTKGRLEMDGRMIVWNEKNMGLIRGPESKQMQLVPTPKNINERLLAGFVRGGVETMGNVPAEGSIEALLPISALKLGSKTKLGDKDIQIVEFELNTKGDKLPCQVALWIDLASGLPVKRVVRYVERNGDVSQLTEEVQITLEGKVDPRGFDIAGGGRSGDGVGDPNGPEMLEDALKYDPTNPKETLPDIKIEDMKEGSGDSIVGGHNPGTRHLRQARWTIILTRETPETFLKKLVEIKAILLCPDGDSVSSFKVCEEPGKRPVEWKMITREGVNKYNRLWYMSHSKTDCEYVTTGLDMTKQPRWIAIFIPNDLEKVMADAEFKYKKLSEKELNERKWTTIFEVDRRDDKWDVRIRYQGPKK